MKLNSCSIRCGHLARGTVCRYHFVKLIPLTLPTENIYFCPGFLVRLSLAGGPVGPPARWAATSNVERGVLS